MKCVMCRKDSLVSTGFHLDCNLDFCGNRCIARFVEKLYPAIEQHEERLGRLEELIRGCDLK